MRWNHSELGFILPDKFIVYAEKIRVMSTINEWMISRVFDDYHAGLDLLSYISMNFSANELNALGTVDFIMNSMQKANFPMTKMVLELTEIADFPKKSLSIIDKIKKLTNAGVRIAIDDYGTGYSL